jgi:hypothetical protein
MGKRRTLWLVYQVCNLGGLETTPHAIVSTKEEATTLAEHLTRHNATYDRYDVEELETGSATDLIDNYEGGRTWGYAAAMEAAPDDKWNLLSKGVPYEWNSTAYLGWIDGIRARLREEEERSDG